MVPFGCVWDAICRQQLTIRARELGTLAASLELLPPAQLQRGFNYAPLWQQLLSEAAAAASDLEGAAAEEGEEAAALSAIEEGLDAFEVGLGSFVPAAAAAFIIAAAALSVVAAAAAAVAAALIVVFAMFGAAAGMTCCCSPRSSS